MFTLAQSYNSGYRRRIANRSGELRHEEFSHCCVHGSVGRGKFRRSMLCNFFQTISLKVLAKGGEQIENIKETTKNCLKKYFPAFLLFCFSFCRYPMELWDLNDIERVGPSWLVQNNGFPPPLFSVSAHFSHLVNQRDEERKLHRGTK